jgi:hypothetical protein
MEFPQKVKPRQPMICPVWPWRSLLSGLLFLTLTGCPATESFVSTGDKPPTGDVCQVVATWNNQVVTTNDPANGGAPIKGIAGRMYLFGTAGDFPKAGDGCAVIDLYDDSHITPAQPPVLLEEWRIDKVTLQKLLRKDPIGWGYTLFLPWGTYKPEIAQIHLKLRFEPSQGGPLYCDGSRLTLNREDNQAYAANTPNPRPLSPSTGRGEREWPIKPDTQIAQPKPGESMQRVSFPPRP